MVLFRERAEREKALATLWANREKERKEMEEKRNLEEKRRRVSTNMKTYLLGLQNILKQIKSLLIHKWICFLGYCGTSKIPFEGKDIWLCKT